ncbi:hypothetical protein BIV60_25805 [Bacillus sp. MUM 116]|uniref:hypothetical protein n=1 Tax=Bacillus sp. MUM 116 TaxID=1678002 RepID=UPI0008F5A471|nr:hypothetical protein [Bacillus sp. MUM 116]OIK08626.1 hypothetical protein BIV60_25805 [Bacillus sp. MUM 116]
MIPTILIPGIQGTKLVNTNTLNFASVYELCPTYKDAIVFKNGAEFNLFNPDHCQSNISDRMIIVR